MKVSWWLRDAYMLCMFCCSPRESALLARRWYGRRFPSKKEFRNVSATVSFDRMQIPFRSFMSYKLPLMHAQFLLILGISGLFACNSFFKLFDLSRAVQIAMARHGTARGSAANRHGEVPVESNEEFETFYQKQGVVAEETS